MNRQQRKQTLLQLFQAGVDAVGGMQATRRALASESLQSTLHAPLHLVAIGKAADAMAQGALCVIGDRLDSALVITKHDHLSETLKLDSRFETHESGHPMPDEQSLIAGARLYEYVAGLKEDHLLIFLLSGGASALVEHLDNDLTLEDLRSTTDQLLASGAPIGEMNRQRRQLSLIKGGKLASVLRCNVLQLLISDVPGDKPGDIGSGPLVPDADTAMPEDLPVWQRVDTRIIASSTIAQKAVCEAAKARGLSVQQASGNLDGDIVDVSARVADTLSNAKPGVYIWGGEPTVVLPCSPGRGGRNQHLALSLAKTLATHGSVSALVCGTDGTDGPTGDAGGLLDESSAKAAVERGVDIDQYLLAADAGTALETLDMLVTTGPTGTNVMDLCIAMVV